MTLRAPSEPGLALRGATERSPEHVREQTIEAARQFESLLLQQLVSVMRQSAGGTMDSSGAAGQYMSMFDEAIATHMSQGAGLGLQQMLVQTITGEGGVGKTRLALAVSARGVGRFPDGVWFVPAKP